MVNYCEGFEKNFGFRKRRVIHSVSELLRASQERLFFVVQAMLRHYFK